MIFYTKKVYKIKKSQHPSLSMFTAERRMERLIEGVRWSAFTLLEVLITYSIIALLMTVLMFGFKNTLNSVTLKNETRFLLRYLEYAQNYSYTFQDRVTWEVYNTNMYRLKVKNEKVLKKRYFPKDLNISIDTITFTKKMTPSKGGTIILKYKKLEKRLIIDPVTGRIRVEK